MSIRRAELKDKYILKELLYEQHVYHSNLRKDIFDKILKDELITDDWLESIINSDETNIILSEDDGLISGLIMFSENSTDNPSYHDEKWLYIEELIVSKSFRRRGIGKKLMDHVEQVAKESNIHVIKLHVWDTNDSTIDFYKSNMYETKQLSMWKRI